MPRSRKREERSDPWLDLLEDPDKFASLAEEFRAQQERLRQQIPTYHVPGSRFD